MKKQKESIIYKHKNLHDYALIRKCILVVCFAGIILAMVYSFVTTVYSAFNSPPLHYPTAPEASLRLNTTCRIPSNWRVYCCDFGRGYERQINYNPYSQTFVEKQDGGLANWNLCEG